ncbi:MAG: redoxin domain-containing protein [Anaerolineales bacterium]|nr:redoxin domain-containing protein [Anaerolineales bacterium]
MDPIIKTGAPAPSFTLKDLEGKSHTLSDYHGKLAVIVFWSAECPWSSRADHTLNQMRLEWGEDIAVLAIASNANESLEEKTAAASARGVSLVLLDEKGRVARLFGAMITPEVFLIDQEGILRYQGAFDDASFRQPEPTRNYLWEAVEAVLADENPVPSEVPSYGCTIVLPPEA